MVKVAEGNILESKAQIIVQLVNDDGDLKNNIPPEINDQYHHITREYVRYINNCRKNGIDTMGRICFIPLDVWAIGLVDVLKSNRIEVYDKDYQYIVCAFARTRIGKKYKIDYDSLKNCLRYICNKAQAVKTDIAIPYSEMVENVVKEVFGKSTVNVTLYKNIS